MALIQCPDCQKTISDQAPSCPNCGRPIKADAEPAEETLLVVQPAMFRARPFYFMLCVLLVPVVIGIIMLITWGARAGASKLTITTRRSILETGWLRKHSTEVMHSHVRNIQIDQTFLQSLLNVGAVGISSAAQGDVELAIHDIPGPKAIRDLINAHRRQP